MLRPNNRRKDIAGKIKSKRNQQQGRSCVHPMILQAVSVPAPQLAKKHEGFQNKSHLASTPCNKGTNHSWDWHQNQERPCSCQIGCKDKRTSRNLWIHWLANRNYKNAEEQGKVVHMVQSPKQSKIPLSKSPTSFAKIWSVLAMSSTS